MNEPATALIAGAGGLTGSHLLPLLLDSPRYRRVVALVRKPLAAAHPKLDQQIVDFAALPALPLDPGAHFFCALGSTIRKAGSRDAFRLVDVDYPLALARLAAARSAAVFVIVSSTGADPASSNFYLRTKGEAEDAVVSAALPATHIFRPGILAGPRSEFRPGERIGLAAASLFQWALTGSLRRYRTMPVSILARAMAASAWSGATGAWVHEYDEIRALASAWPD